MERNLPLCLVILIIYYNVHILEASYAYITVSPTDIQIGVNLTMSCKYNGSFTVSSVFWERNSAGVQIRLFATCILANVPDSTVYNMNRTTYSCDQASNIYSLILNNIVAEDDKNSWSCSLRLSAGNLTNPAVYVISLPSYTTTTTTSTTTQISSTRTTTPILTNYTEIGTTQNIPATTSRPLPVVVIIGVSVGGFIFILLILIVCCCCKGCCFYRCRKEQNTAKYEDDNNGNANKMETQIKHVHNQMHKL